MGPTPYKWLLPELDLHLSREQATLAPFSRNSGVGHSGSCPPLHWRDPTPCTGGCSWCLIALWGSLTWVWEGMSGDWGLWANSTCRSRAMGTIGADCSRVARATTPGPLPQPHGWVRLGFEVSRFPHFRVEGLACAEFSRGVEFRGSLAPFFLHILKQKKLIKKEYCRCGPTPYKWLLPELDLHLSREQATLAPFSRNSGVGHSGSCPPLHWRDPNTLHRRLFLMPHCTLRLSHLSVGGNVRRLGIVGQLDM